MNGFNISIQGFSHISKNIVCQDNSAYYCDKNIALAIVADGHGGEKYFRSDIGSKMAVDAANYSIKEFMTDINSFNKAIENNSNRVLTKIEQNIIYIWNNLINEHYKNNPITELEKSKFDLTDISIESIYGSTLVVAVVTNNFWFGIQIGDGSCVSLYDNCETKMLIPTDDRLVANFTTSLCSSNAIHDFRHYYSNEIPIAVIVSTDGLINSFKTENSFLNFNRRVISQMNEYDTNIENLTNHLYKRSKEGSLDDISIAGVYKKDIDFDKLKISG